MSNTDERKKVPIRQLLNDLGQDHIVMNCPDDHPGDADAPNDENEEEWIERHRPAVVADWRGLFDCFSPRDAGQGPHWQRDYFNGEALLFENTPCYYTDNEPGLHLIPWNIIGQLLGKVAKLGLTVNYQGRRWLVPPCWWEIGQVIGEFKHGDPDTLLLLPLDMIDMEGIELD